MSSVPPPAGRPLTIFVSYAREDAEWVTDDGSLVHYLAAALKRNHVRVWVDEWILPGQKYEEEILAALNAAELALLMVSESFFASDYIRDTELPRIRERAREDHLVVIPILVAPCDWSELDFISSRQMLPGKEPTPLTDYTGPDRRREFQRMQAEILAAIRAQIAIVREREPQERTGATTHEGPPRRAKQPAVAPPVEGGESVDSAAWLAGGRLAMAGLAAEQLAPPPQAQARAARFLVEADRFLQWLDAPPCAWDPADEPASWEQAATEALAELPGDPATALALGLHMTRYTARLEDLAGDTTATELWPRIVEDHREVVPLTVTAQLPTEVMQQFASLLPAGARTRFPSDVATMAAAAHEATRAVLEALRQRSPAVPAERKRTLDRLTPLP